MHALTCAHNPPRMIHHGAASATTLAGGRAEEAVGVAAQEMQDPQLALLLCRLLHGSAGSNAELRLVGRLHDSLRQSQHAEAPAMAAACCLLQGDAAGALQALLGSIDATPSLGLADAAEEDSQLLPVLAALLQSLRALSGGPQTQQQLAARLAALGRRLQGCGLHGLAIEPMAAAALLPGPRGTSDRTSAAAAHQRQQQDEALLQRLVAMSLLPSALEAPASTWQGRAAAQVRQLAERGLCLEADAVLSLLHDMRSRTSSAADAHASAAGLEPRSRTEHHAAIDRRGSSGGGSARSHGSGRQPAAAGGAVVDEGCAACTPRPSPAALQRLCRLTRR